MAKIIDSLECGKCGEIFHQLEVFIKHKMSNCTPKDDSDDSESKDSKKPKKMAKKPSITEINSKGNNKFNKDVDKVKKKDLKRKISISPKSPSKKSKLLLLDSDSPKLKGVTGYLWKKRIMQEQLKEQKRRQIMHAKRKNVVQYPSDDEASFEHIHESSDSEESGHERSEVQCGECSGCQRQEDCMECDVCLRKLEDPDIDDVCILRECTAEPENEVYKVEKILAKRFRFGRFEYLIKWKGYPSSENTWEPKENILSPKLLEEFEKRHNRLLAKRSQPTLPAPRKRKKFYYTESSDDSSQDEIRASRMFAPATPLDAKRGRSSKKAAMNFIKTVCLKGRRPSPEVVTFSEPLTVSDSDSHSKSPSPEPIKKKVIIEIPDPKEKGKFIKVKGEAKNIKFLKDCDLNPVVNLSPKVPDDEEGIQAFVFEDIIRRRMMKVKEKDKERKKNVESKPKSVLQKQPKVDDIEKWSPKIVTSKITGSNKVTNQKLTKQIDTAPEKKKRITYQEKIENLINQEKNFEDYDISYDDPDDSFIGGDSKTLAELRESLRQNMKKTEEKKVTKIKTSDTVPKEGARKNFVRPLKPKIPGQIQSPVVSVTQPVSTVAGTVVSNKSALISGKDNVESSNERVFVVMPDGSMVEVSTAKAGTNLSKSATDSPLKSVPKEKPKPSKISTKKPVGQVSLEDCTGDAIDDSRTLKLPNTLQLVQSELPLSEAENSEKLIGMFLFRQVISPNDSSHKCLLCLTKNTFRYLLDLEKHYSAVHELASQTFKAEFSENIVFVCVPPDVTEQTTLNSVCRFCDITLKNLAEVRSHYPTSHNKVVRLVQEQQVTELSSSLFCSICSEMSKNFTDHHTHMKTVHRMQTYVCKYCNFITSRANRLKAHAKQKHPQIASPQTNNAMAARGSKAKLKCPVCQLFINGKDNLDQHILLAHSVQTGPETWSCSKCLQPCGTAKEFIVHVFSCTSARADEQIKSSFEKQALCVYKCIQCALTFMSEKEIKKHIVDSKHSQNFEVIKSVDDVGKYNCFLCGKKFVSAEMFKKHCIHVHMVWVDKNLPKHSESSSDDTIPKGENNEKDDISSALVIKDIPEKEELLDLGLPTKIGHYCHICDSVIKSYSLYYLHMQDLHSSEKRFQCIISSCQKTFTSPKEFQKHANAHKQDLAYTCSICDLIFVNESELREHNLSMEHGTRYMKMHEKCRPSGIEARNHQCKVCQTWFGLRYYLIKHMETDNHDYKCQKCGLQYLQPGSRRLHIQQVHPEIASICEFCQLKLQSTQSVWGHLKTHGIVHECEQCHRRFLHKEQVTTHMEAHDPPMQCPWKGCTRQLVTKISLYYHLKTHRGDEDHKCPYCQKGFIKQKLLEAHMRTHEADAAASKKDEPSVDQKSHSESELVQLICAGCDKGFDDEDQFASHECTDSKQTHLDTNMVEVKGASITSLSVAEPAVESNDTMSVEKSTNVGIDSKKANTVGDILDNVLEDSGDIEMLQHNNSILPLNEKADEKNKENNTIKSVEAIPENNEDSPDKNLNLESEVSNNDEERKDFIDGVLSISNQESNDGSTAQFDDIPSEMVLVMEKNQSINLEDSESISNQEDLHQAFPIDTENKQEENLNEESTIQPMDISEPENKLHSDKFLESDDQQAYSEVADSDQQMISGLTDIQGEDSSITESDAEKKNHNSITIENPADIITETAHETETESEQTVVMMVADPQDDSQGMELELPDDPSYAGATLLKVPTSDGKQVLLIPFSSTEGGTAVLSLPPGLTLEPDGSPHGQPIHVALEDAAGADENGETSEQRYLHVPVEGEVMGELLQGRDDIQVHDKITTDSIVSDNDITLQCNQD